MGRRNFKPFEIFDVKEVQLKFNEYKQKDEIINMIMRKLGIESKKIANLVKNSKLFEDLTDDQFHVLNLIFEIFLMTQPMFKTQPICGQMVRKKVQ